MTRMRHDFNRFTRDFSRAREMHKALCTECGKEIEVPFLPAEGRSLFCRDCYQKQMHKAFCTECGKEIEVSFHPPEGRSLLCRDCHQKHRKPVFDAQEEERSFRPPDFEFAGIVGPDGQPLEPNVEIPTPIRLTVCEVNAEVLAYLRAHPEAMRDLPSRKFEQLIAELLTRRGYNVELTPCTRDGGFDMYAAQNTSLGRFLFLVECKRYRPPKKVGVVPVRSLYGVVQEKRATAGVIATTSYFSNDARTFQGTVEHQLKLHDYVVLQEWLASI